VTAAIPKLSCRGLSLVVAGRTLVAGLDFDVREGERWVVVGPNGAGKTTLVSALAGLNVPAAGEIRYDGKPIASLAPRERAKIRGFLPQESIDHFPATVLETALVGRHPHLARWQWESAADIDSARLALAALLSALSITRGRSGSPLMRIRRSLTIRCQFFTSRDCSA